MSEGTMVTKGTRMFFAYSASEILKVRCTPGITLGGGATDDIDVTCLDSLEREFVAGFKTPDDITVPINFSSRSASHQALENLYDTGEKISWMVVLSDQDGEPTTLDTDGRLVSPGATTREFIGHVKNLSLEIPLNEIVRGTLTIKRSGEMARVNPTADLD